MKADKPKTIDEYVHWLEIELSVTLDGRTQNRYDVVSKKIKESYENSVFWESLNKNLGNYDITYLANTKYNLLVTKNPLKIMIKPYQSVIEKTFRKNIIENKRWPSAPQNGWVTPDNWFSRIQDIVRSIIVVKYLDGVDFIKDCVRKELKTNKMKCETHMESRDDGYYAAHLYTTLDVEIPLETWKTAIISAPFELQVTTQLQVVIRLLLHTYYERKRSKDSVDNGDWKWQYNSDEFVTNYLGHILHYVEGMIMEVRERQKEV